MLYKLTCTLFFISAALFANPSHQDNYVLTEDNYILKPVSVKLQLTN